ncbi:MAG: phage integrase family protein [Tenericutes bacterium]|nr:phage integrase family protein [Mycoplasmatota bacterium]
MKINEILKKYEEYKKYFSSNGDYNYCKSHINVLRRYFDKINVSTTEQIKDDFVMNFIAYKKILKNSINTINKEIILLRAILRFKDIRIPIFEKFKKISFKRKSFNLLNMEQLRRLINYYKSKDLEKPVNLTSYLVFYLLLYTGSRRSELINIKIREIDLENYCIYLNHTKNNRPRLVFYNNRVTELLKKYIELKPKREYFFYNFKKNEPLTAENVSSIFKYVKKTLKLYQYSPHMLRHTMATLLVENNAPIISIQNLLGHASSKTTDIYLHMSVKKTKKDFNQYFPSQI